MLGRFVSDLAAGEVLRPVVFVVSPYIVREYCHGVEEDTEIFHSTTTEGPQLAPPTILHVAQSRLVSANCPGGSGSKVRVHYEYEAAWRGPIFAGDTLRVEGYVEDLYERRGRTYISVKTTSIRETTEEVVGIYRQITLMNMEPGLIRKDRPS
jgi:hypothetical protein